MIRFHQIGRWRTDQIRSRWTQSSWRETPVVRAVIESTWQRGLAQSGVKLFDGPMCRLESLTRTGDIPSGDISSGDARDGDGLSLALSPTSYKTFYGTNLMNPALADAHGADVMANAVGVSVGLKSADGSFLLGRRNASVGYYPNRLHPFAGTLEPRDVPDVFHAALRELDEELAISVSDLSSIDCVGVAEDLALRQPELIFFASATLSRDELASRTRADEHMAAWSVAATADEVTSAMDGNQLLTPVARATLMLCGRIEFGDGWFEKFSGTACGARPAG